MLYSIALGQTTNWETMEADLIGTERPAWTLSLIHI